MLDFLPANFSTHPKCLMPPSQRVPDKKANEKQKPDQRSNNFLGGGKSSQGRHHLMEEETNATTRLLIYIVSGEGREWLRETNQNSPVSKRFCTFLAGGGRKEAAQAERYKC
jgi:hypothetical protein